MSAPDKIIELIDRFRCNKDDYRSGNYKEAHLRKEFIDPFFSELGWDMNNSKGYAEAYKDVIHEDSIKIGNNPEAPDYCFRIGGTRKFFLEAKKPSVNIRTDTHPAYQLRRYAWSSKLPMSILTDFEEFAVYDCRVKPVNTDDASKARIKYLTYDQYPESWDYIESIFSRESILKGNYDRHAETNKGKKGTAEVDKEFLKEIESWRDELARNIALRNPGLTRRELNFTIQRTIDRIVFLRICEDRSIEEYQALHALLNGTNTYQKLCELFYRADQRYNSGLFHFDHEKDEVEPPDDLSPKLKIDDKPLKSIIKRLYYPDSPYEFSVLPADILGQVYEQFLGKVIRLTDDHRAIVEDKPEVKKAGGVFYTPTYIVDYIVKNTVGALLEGKKPDEASKLRILDPACGSGSFLIGAYQFLLDWHLKYYTEHTPAKWVTGRNPRLVQISNLDYRLTTDERKRILLNNIYGVDIDTQAVEVTKLSLLLKVLEGETRQTIENQLKLFHKRALPDLASNIKCGNSLIGPDFYNGQTSFGFMDEDEKYRINVFDWKCEFPEIFKAGGFDAVIGNPPYIRIQALKEWAPKEVEFYKKKYISASKGNYDIYVVFVEKGLNLLNQNGKLGFILPHKFFNAQYGESLREMVSKGKYLSQIVHFGDNQVFDTATTYTALMFLTKQGNKSFNILHVNDLRAWRVGDSQPNGDLLTETISEKVWNFTIGKSSSLLNKLSQISTKLSDVTDRIFVGIQTSADPVFLLSLKEYDSDKSIVYSKALGIETEIESGILKPLLKGAEIRRYSLNEPENVILFPYNDINGLAVLLEETELKSGFPLAWNYLCATRKLLESRESGKWKVPKWWQFGRNQNIAEMLKPKILTQVLANHSSFTLDNEGKYCFVGGGNAGGYGIYVSSSSNLSELYVLCLINSRLLDWYLKKISTMFRGGYFSYAKRFIEVLPIRIIDTNSSSDIAYHDRMVSLVSSMLELNKQLAAARTADEKTALQRIISATDNEIDKLVYELYGLTEEEIGIVEGEK